MAVRNNHSDHEVVRTEDLARILETWIKEFEADNALFKATKQLPMEFFGRAGDGYPVRYKGVKCLSIWAGVSDRKIRYILAKESAFTMFDTADLLLTACGEGHALEDGRVPVYENRGAWSMVKRDQGVENTGGVEKQPRGS